MSLSRERMGFLPVLDQFFPRTKPQESIATEAEVRQRLHEAMRKDIDIMALAKTHEQGSVTDGFGLPQFKIGKTRFNAYMRRGSGGFEVDFFQWKDDEQSDGNITPLHEIRFVAGQPAVHSAQQESLEAKYNRIARTSDRVHPANMLTKDLKPSPISLADLQIVANQINQARIEYQANATQLAVEHPQAA